jgi:sulfur relay (sulfurtransferase) complex TusBCD TusD component (DsrE family)
MNMATLTIGIMDPPYESANTPTAFRLVDAAIRKGHNVYVFCYEGATVLAYAGQKQHPNTVHGASLEEQDDPAVWFTHAMKNGGGDVSILLRGDAVNYALLNQDARGLRFGARAVKGPDMVRDIKAVIAKKIPLYAVADDLAERGLTSSQLIPGVEQIQRSGIARLIEGHDRLLSW